MLYQGGGCAITKAVTKRFAIESGRMIFQKIITGEAPLDDLPSVLRDMSKGSVSLKTAIVP